MLLNDTYVSVFGYMSVSEDKAQNTNNNWAGFHIRARGCFQIKFLISLRFVFEILLLTLHKIAFIVQYFRSCQRHEVRR
jgi:hypothetical protein